jgi:hypothetical protein
MGPQKPSRTIPPLCDPAYTTNINTRDWVGSIAYLLHTDGPTANGKSSECQNLLDDDAALQMLLACQSARFQVHAHMLLSIDQAEFLFMAIYINRELTSHIWKFTSTHNCFIH